MNSEEKVIMKDENPSTGNLNFVSMFYMKFKWQILIFFAILVPIGAFKFFLPGITNIDEVAKMSGAAFTAGLDWSRVVSLLPYFGFGLSSLLFPVFLFELSPYAILVIIRLVNTALIAVSGVVAYNIMTGIFKVEVRKLSVITSIAAACFTHNILNTNIVSNESMLVFLNWVILYVLLLMVKRVESGKSNSVYSLMLSILMCYGLLVHTRMIFVWGAVFVFVLCYLMINRKILIDIKVFFPSFILLFILSRSLISYVQANVWLAGGDELVNTIELVARVLPARLSTIFNITALSAFFRLTIGQTWSASTFTVGLAPLLLTSLVFCVICLIWRKTRESAYELVKENIFLFLATTYTIAQIAAIILLTAFTQTAVEDLRRWLLYDRYWASAIGPVFLLSIILLYKMKKAVVGKLIRISAVFIIIVNILFAYLVAPSIYGTGIAGSAIFQHLGALAFMRLDDVLNATQFFIIIAFVATVSFSIHLLVRKQKLHLLSVLVLAFFLYHFSFTTIQYYRPRFQSFAAEYRHVVTLFNDSNISLRTHPYVYMSIQDRWNDSLANLQFNLYRHSIVPTWREFEYPHCADTAEIPIYITNSLYEGSLHMFFGRDHKIVDFGEEFVGHQVLINTADTALVAQIESAGYELSTFDTLHFDTDSLGFHRVNATEELELFLAPGNISLGVLLPAGDYRLTLRRNNLLVEQAELPTIPDGMTIADNVLTYSFTLDYGKTLAEFFSSNAAWGFVEYLLVNNIWYIDQLEDMELRITARFPLRQLAAYELGTAIYFDEDNANYHGHILSGMPLQEESGAWTQGHMAEFVFFLSDAQGSEQRINDDLLFSFTAEPLVTPSYRAPEPGQPRLIAQRVEIEVNGEVLDVMNIIRHGTYEVHIPADLIADNNRLHIILRLPTATSPAALDIDPDDDRVLALFLEEMRIGVIS